MSDPDLRLVRIDADTWQRAVALKPRPEQERFVASNTYSLAEAAYSPEMVPWLAVAGDEDVGFALHGVDPEDGRPWIVRFMIDARHQGRGHGARMLDVLVARLRRAYAGEPIRLGCVPGNEVAERLYVSRGFRATGEVLHGETILELPAEVPLLKDAPAPGAPDGAAESTVADPARLGRTVVLAPDLDAIAIAYREAFGWTTIVDMEAGPGRRYLHVGSPAQPGVGAWFLTPAGEEGRARVGAQTGGEPLLVLYVVDLRATRERAVAAGFEADAEPAGGASATWLHLRDPLGNRIVLVRLGG